MPGKLNGYGPPIALFAVIVVIALASLGFASDWGAAARGVKENHSLIDAQAAVVSELGKISVQNRVDMAFIRGSLEQLLGKESSPILVGEHPPHGG